MNELRLRELLSQPLLNGITRPKAVRGEGTKMVNMGELFAHRRIGDLEMSRVPLADGESRFLLAYGDLLFARQSLVLAGAGLCSIFTGRDEATFESHIIRARLDPAKADPRYFSYYFSSPQGRQRIESIVEQVAAAGIRSSDLSQLKVPCPPVEEQRRVAEILWDVDDKIDLNRHISRTMLQLGVAIVARSSDHAQAVSSLCRVTRSSVQPADHPDEPFSHFSLPAFDRGEGPILERGRLIHSHKLQLTRDCILLSRLNPSIPRLWLPDVDPSLRAIASTEWLVVVPVGPWRNALFAALNRPEFLDAFASLATGTTGSHQRVSATDFLGMHVPWPEGGLLNELETQLELLFDLTAALNRQNRTLAELRDLILPKLMSGEIQVKEAQKAAAEAL